MTKRWYDIVPATENLTQGDLISNCPVLTWRSVADRAQNELSSLDELYEMAIAVSADVIVMTQACDLEQSKVDEVILCAHQSLSEYKEVAKSAYEAAGQNFTEKSWKKMCDNIANGRHWDLSMLNPHDRSPKMDHRIVSFNNVYSLPRVFLERILHTRRKRRLRLRPPYREHLSQAFARFFMRVGLPTDIKKDW